jgi:hypothetical protein
MSSNLDPKPDPSAVNDEESFLAFVKALEADRRLAAALEKEAPVPYGSHRGWENATIEQFLEAATSWAEDTRFGRSQRLEGVSPWRQFAVFLYCGKIYE